jgi:hypothetical protein
MLAEVAADRRAAVALVANQALGSEAVPPAPAWAPHRAALQQRGEDRVLVPLAGRQQEDEGLAAAFGAEVELGAAAAPAPVQRLRSSPPFAC